jgi:small subunit ribosomal protein S2
LAENTTNNLIKELIDAGIHFGHRASRWNPKMKPYIYGKRNDLHIIDVKQTLRGLLLAKKFITRTVAGGKDIVLVGTKRQARKSVRTHAERVGMHWVNDRWLGGTLTNFREIRKRVARLEELEAMEAEGTMDAFSKKEGSRLRREMRKIQRNLGGIRNMERFPGAVVVIDAVREHIAVREAQKSGVPVIGLIDTDTDPACVDIPIPGNDDAMRAIEIIARELADAAQAGIGQRNEGQQDEEGPQPKRRSRRATTARAEEPAEEAATADESAESTSTPAAAAEEAATENQAPAAEETTAPAEEPAKSGAEGELVSEAEKTAEPAASESKPAEG